MTARRSPWWRSALKTPRAPTPAMRSRVETPAWTSELGTAIVVPAGTEIVTQDAAPAAVALLDDGVVTLLRREPGRGALLVGLRFPGWFIGAESVIVGQSSPVSGTALTQCRVCRIPPQTFLRWLKSDADLAWRINQMQGRELFDQMRRSIEQGRPARERLLACLRQLLTANEATALEKRIRMRLPVSGAQLAELAGVSVAQARRLLKILAEDGDLRVRGNVITVVNPRRFIAAHVRDVGWPINAQPRDRSHPSAAPSSSRRYQERS